MPESMSALDPLVAKQRPDGEIDTTKVDEWMAEQQMEIDETQVLVMIFFKTIIVGGLRMTFIGLRITFIFMTLSS